MFSPGMGWRWEFGKQKMRVSERKNVLGFQVMKIPFYSGKFPLNHYLENMFLVVFEAF